jgi:hypothetical protein
LDTSRDGGVGSQVYEPKSIDSRPYVSANGWLLIPRLQPPSFPILDPSPRSLSSTRHKMKSATVFCFAIASLTHAYPDISQHIKSRDSKAGSSWGGLLPLTTPKFDAEAQRVETTGEHAWKAPGKNDQRGPCPGLNALANHGYLPHNGIGTIDQFIDSVMKG